MSNNLPTLASLKQTMKNKHVIERFVSTLGKEEAGTFMTSIINITAANKALQKCTEESIMSAAFKSASLKLPIEPTLGRAYIIPYGDTASLQIGYKGIRELAIRSGLYTKIRAVEVYEDELDYYNPITGDVKFTDIKTWKFREDPKKSPIGYYAFFIMNTGFEANVYMSKAEVEKHATKFSQAYKSKKKDSPWFQDFDKMACKTVLKRLLNDHGILSIEMRSGIITDTEEDSIDDQREPEPENTRQEAPKAEKTPKPTDDDVIDNEPDPKQDDEDPFG